MSQRKLGRGQNVTLPENPHYLDFPRTDGDETLWPSNTAMVVDHEGCVNYMRPVAIDESSSISWRVSVGAKVAERMGLPKGPAYVLRKWPDGYHFYDHNKGKVSAPRHDPYLIGSRLVNRFRSTNEFVPHAVWLMTDPTTNRANCECKYCAKKPQRIISDEMGLSSKRSTPQASTGPRKAIVRQRRERVRQPNTKPYTAVRRVPKPAKLPAGPEQCIVPERDCDIRAALDNKTVGQSRWFRKAEVVWCAIESPIIAPNGVSISLWPGVVEEVNVKTEAVRNEDVDVAQGVDVRPSAGQSNADESVVQAETKVPWTIRQWNLYSVKLLAITRVCYVSDAQVMPYLAYRPSDDLLRTAHDELFQVMDSITPEEMEGNLNRIFDFDPYSMEDVSSIAAEQFRFMRAAMPYTLAIEIASKMAHFWQASDDWTCKYLIPPPNPPPNRPTTGDSSTSRPQPSLHEVMMQAMAHNATQDPSARMLPPEGGPEGISSEEFQSMKARMLGPEPRPGVIEQTRFQGLWWGAERIWTDELVRLKLARCQFAPHGTDLIKPPAGPSEAAVAYVREKHEKEGSEMPPLAMLGAAEKSIFMQLEGIFTVELEKSDGQGYYRECRASGMVYELADEGWEEPDAAMPTSGKGKEIADANTVDESGQASAAVPSASGASEGFSSPSFMPDPSPLKPPPLPNPDPTVTVAETVSETVAQTAPAAKKKRTLNNQLSRPVLTTPFPLPPAPVGYKFRPIFPPGYEVVVSLALIAGRYYPRLFNHPLMEPTVRQALEQSEAEGGYYEHRHIWAMDGILPGAHQSMDPVAWKPSRQDMMKEATTEAREQLRVVWKQQRERQQSEVYPSASQGSAAQLAEDIDMDEP